MSPTVKLGCSLSLAELNLVRVPALALALLIVHLYFHPFLRPHARSLWE